MSVQFYPTTIQKIQRITPSSVGVYINYPAVADFNTHFQPGQNIAVRIQIDGQTYARSYSLCPSAIPGTFYIIVKKVHQGLLSNYINHELLPDQAVEITAPKGKFVLNEGFNHYTFFATGSGITPIFTMMQSLVANQPTARLHLLFGNTTPEETIFYHELQQILKDHPQVDIHFFFSRQTGQPSQHIDAMTIEAVAKHYPILQAQAFYLCGVVGMLENVKNILAQHHIEAEKIATEAFFKKPTVAAPAAAPVKETSDVTVILDGVHTQFEMPRKEKTILEVANTLGADLPFSCLDGICCACRAKVVEGKVEMIENIGLDIYEERKGYVLTCQAQPRSEKVVISFDEKG